MKENDMKENEIKEKELEENESSLLQTVCNLFIIAILAVLPLYTGEGYYMLGDRKYLIFRNITLFCVGLWLIISVVSALYLRLEKWVQGRKKKQEVFESRLQESSGESFRQPKQVSVEPETMEQMRSQELDNARLRARGDMQKKASVQRNNSFMVEIRKHWSAMDICMLLYAAVCLLSFLCSAYGATAWSGYRDWYMGALSQLLFVGIYFFVSREYAGEGYPIYLGEAALGLVALVGFGQKLGIDPLKLLVDYQPTNWGYSHMLSTVGNINWLCGYLAVVISLPVAGYLYSKPSAKRNILYIISVLGLALLFMQGSEIGIVIGLVCIGICLLAGLRKSEFFEKGLGLAAGTLLCLAVLALLITLRDTMDTMPAEANIFYNIPWSAYLILAGMGGALWLIFQKMFQKVEKPVIKSVLLLGIVTVGVGGIYYLSKMQFTPAWGSGRGGLWNASWQGFLAGDWKQKLIGAGPDCFAEYLYTHLDMGSLLQMEGHWSESIFTNAHNEWLNTLVNLGLLGVCAYLSIFICGAGRYRRMLLGVLVLGMYAVNSLVSFQQVMNAPLFFLVLGLCENRLRRELRE